MFFPFLIEGTARLPNWLLREQQLTKKWFKVDIFLWLSYIEGLAMSGFFWHFLIAICVQCPRLDSLNEIARFFSFFFGPPYHNETYLYKDVAPPSSKGTYLQNRNPLWISVTSCGTVVAWRGPSARHPKKPVVVHLLPTSDKKRVVAV